MRDLPPPYRLDLRTLLSDARRKLSTRVEGLSINLPFLSFRVNPNDLEQQVAREIIIRMADRRVLNASECCDNCIDQALASLQKIRDLLVDKQVQLSHAVDSPLYLLIELQLEAIRQFLTFEQRINSSPAPSELVIHGSSDFRRTRDAREQYYAALEMLRGHLHRCLLQTAKIGNTTIPKNVDRMRYEEAWQLDAYEKPLELENRV
jgi:hypothetical protein